MVAWPRGTWRVRGSGRAHGRVDTWVGYVGRKACMILRSREFGEGTGGGSVVLTRPQKTSKEAMSAASAAAAAAGLGQGDGRGRAEAAEAEAMRSVMQ